ncbi:hypothetical protein MKW94_006784 [Papaver nudicaule]|uniref:Pre-mRNA splicing factor component Cdc5p/Cef1 C-terminal domain-containing protein n=1 Tax=Papaver nudicaule TaxID=74823 RepID=A0AA41V9E3_PAPNU|nr:hypothetical protein [Papaver nudicaule]
MESPFRSTLKEKITSSTLLNPDEIIKDLATLRWNEWSIGSTRIRRSGQERQYSIEFAEAKKPSSSKEAADLYKNKTGLTDISSLPVAAKLNSSNSRQNQAQKKNHGILFLEMGNCISKKGKRSAGRKRRKNQVNKLNDPETVWKRSKLILPAPQITDHELEEIDWFAGDLIAGSEAEGSGATRELLANYSQTTQQGMTPVGTPQRTHGGKADGIMMETENLARLGESETPLLGGGTPNFHPSDFSDVAPKRRDIQTPNLMAIPLSTDGASGVTPRIGMALSGDAFLSGGTPLREEFHINEDMFMPESLKHELRREAELRRNLQSGLISLPQPRNEYQIVIQPLPQDNDEPEDMIEEDMSDRTAREKAGEEARQEAFLKKRSKVLERELHAASRELTRNSLVRTDENQSSFVPPTVMERRREILGLLEHDNDKYPLDEKVEKERKKGEKCASNRKPAFVPEIEDLEEEEETKEADLSTREDIPFLHVATRRENVPIDQFVKVHDACPEDLMYFPARGAYGLSSVAQNMEKLGPLQNEFENVKKSMNDETKTAQSLEQEIKLLARGYQMHGRKLWIQAEATFKHMDNVAAELECFQALQKQEMLAAFYRVNVLVEEIKKQKELQQNLQHRYGNLVAKQDKIERLFQEYRSQSKLQEEIEVHVLDLLSATYHLDSTPQNQDSAQSGSKEIIVNGEQSSTANMDVDCFASDLLAGSETEGSGGATPALLASRKTPGGKADGIMMEAENARLGESETPLLGGDNLDLHPSEFSGVNLNFQIANPLATPLSTPGVSGVTPRIGMKQSDDAFSSGMTPRGTPLRDELHINEDMDMMPERSLKHELRRESELIRDEIHINEDMDMMPENLKHELRREAELRRNLQSGLINLPQPKNEYQIVIQPLPQDNGEPEDMIEEDMLDRIACKGPTAENANLFSKATGIDEMKVDSSTDSMAVGLESNAKISREEMNGLGCDSNLMSEIPKENEQVAGTISNQDSKADGISNNGDDDITQHAADGLSKDTVSADENLLQKPTEMVDPLLIFSHELQRMWMVGLDDFSLLT